MSRADELLSRINDYRINFDNTKSWREYVNGLDEICNEIPEYLNKASHSDFDKAKNKHIELMKERGEHV